MTVYLGFCPFTRMMEVFEDLYPDKNAVLFWVDDLWPNQGATNWNADGSAVVRINIRQYAENAIDTLAHELAHVAAGYEAAHGYQWKSAYEAIKEEYKARKVI